MTYYTFLIAYASKFGLAHFPTMARSEIEAVANFRKYHTSEMITDIETYNGSMRLYNI